MPKGDFISVYSNLPEGVRKEIIVVIKDKPYTWNAAYVEIKNNTELGKKILAKMKKMELIK